VTFCVAGYECGHYPDIELSRPSDTLAIRVSPAGQVRDTQVVGFAAHIGHRQPGLSHPLLVPFIPRQDSRANQIAAVIHRVAREKPMPDKKTQEDFREYARVYIQAAWTDTISDEDVQSTFDWLDSSSYSGKRKRSLFNLRKKITQLESSFLKVKCFIKKESYMKPKHARAICSFTDETKVILGPLFKAIDKCTFGLDKRAREGSINNPGSRHFVKGTNPSMWPFKLEELFGDNAVMGTDFTSFEAHHHGVMAYVVYYWYLHMTRKLSSVRPFKNLVAAMMLGKRDMCFKHIRAKLDERLMSGALWTSSANGVLNLLLMSYLNVTSANPQMSPGDRARWAVANFKGLVEGDDGLCLGQDIDYRLVKNLGLDLKFAPSPHYSEAGFCGIVCDPQVKAVLKDPIPVLAKFFVLEANFLGMKRSKILALYRARALSYLCNFSKSPIIASLCHWVLHKTRSIDVGSVLCVVEERTRDFVLDAVKREVWRNREVINDKSREIVANLYGVPVARQLEIERCFDDLDSDILDIELSDFVSKDMMHHALNFIHADPDSVSVPIPKYPAIVQSVINNGLKAANARKKCAAYNVKSMQRTEPLDAVLEPDATTW